MLSAHDIVIDVVIGTIKKTCKRPIPLHPKGEHNCINIVESNINIQKFFLQLVHRSF